jgi:hypothetical protein
VSKGKQVVIALCITVGTTGPDIVGIIAFPYRLESIEIAALAASVLTGWTTIA